MVRAKPLARLIVLRPGTAAFAHSPVDSGQLLAAEDEELRFVLAATAAASGVPARLGPGASR